MGQWLRASVTLAKDLGSFASTHKVLHSHLYVTLLSGDPIPFSDLHGHQTHLWCTCVYAGKHLNIKLNEYTS